MSKGYPVPLKVKELIVLDWTAFHLTYDQLALKHRVSRFVVQTTINRYMERSKPSVQLKLAV